MKQAFAWSFLTNYLGIIINFFSVIVLARILTPSEIGTFAIAGAVFAIGQMFRDMGISGYLLRESYLTNEKISGALVVVWALCGCISFSLFFSSVPISKFYNIPDLVPIFKILSINILIIPFGTVAQTFLRRNLDFKSLGMIELLSQLAHLIVALTLAFYDFGSISLALASLSATACTIILANMMCKNVASYKPSLKNVRGVLPHISRIGFANILATLNSRSTPLIVGKTISENAVAIMDKAFAVIELLNQLLMQAIQKVLLPYFTNLKKEKGSVKSAYLMITNFTLLIALPFFFYIAVLSEFVIKTLFGNQWLAAIPLVPLFALSSALGGLVRYFSEVTISMGLEKILLRLNLSIFFITVLAVSLLSRDGLMGVAIAFLLVAVIRTSSMLYLLKIHVGIGFLDFAKELKETVIITMVSTIPYWVGSYFGIIFTEIFEVIILFISVVIVWLSSIFLFKHPARAEITKLLGRIK